MEPSLRERDAGNRASDRLIPFVIGAGVVLRVFHYLLSRSMWFDEACVALNVVRRGFLDLAAPLGFHQAAPVGFLWMEKAAVLALGGGEQSLRLVPMVSGIASLLLFARIVRSTISPRGALISILLFGLSWPLVRYATEVKPYGVDALVTVVIWWIVAQTEQRQSGVWRAVGLGAVGGVLVWCSFPAVFVLAGAGLALGLRAALARDRAALGWTLVAGGMWAISVLLLYLTQLRALSGSSYFADFWHATFMPLPPWSKEWMRWMAQAGGAVLRSTLGLPLSVAGAVAGAVGAVSLIRRRPVAAIFLLSPILFALVASACGRYPFAGRFLLFAAPALLAMMGEGTAQMLLPERRRAATWVGWLIAGALVMQPLALAVEHCARPDAPQEIKPVLAQLRQQHTDGDLLVVDHALLCPFHYYRERFGLSDLRARIVTLRASKEQANKALAEATSDQPIGGRLWLLLSDLGDLDPADVGSKLNLGPDRTFECSQKARATGVVMLCCVRESEAGPGTLTDDDTPHQR